MLDRLDLRIEPGERDRADRRKRQGKTTIVKLLTRLYDPTAGRILLDGVDLRDYSVEDLHRQIGVIFQDFVRYEMTARAEHRDGPDRCSGGDWPFAQAAHKSLAPTRWSSDLPKGYEQMLGRRFEGGVDLSGGEWQKDRAGPRLPARCADPDSRRADGGAGCAAPNTRYSSALPN